MRDAIRLRFQQRPRTSFLALLMLGMVVLYILPGGSVVWATPHQSPLRQTVPTATPTPIPGWIWIGYPGTTPADYAPSGMPDFDQKQAGWQVTSPPGWSHCGPVAVADVLWWLDSQSEPGSNAPPQVSDGHPLIESFGAWDDHDSRNVLPLVSDVAARLNTNDAKAGTEVTTVVPALEAYVREQALDDTYAVAMYASPSFEQLRIWVRRGSGVVLLLGFWEEQGADEWVYLGAHYAAVAGVEPANRYVALADPFRDAWEAGNAALGRSPVAHAYPHGPDVHNDAQYVSHDAYPVVAAQGPGGTWALADYVRASEHLENFVGQNVAQAFAVHEGDYTGPIANVRAKMDYAIVVAQPVTYHLLYLPIIVKAAQ